MSNRAQILITAVDETRRAFQSVQGNLARLRGEAAQVTQVLSRIGGALGLGFGTRELVAIVDQYRNLQARLRLAVTSQEEFTRAYAALVEIAQRSRAPLAEIVTLYARLAPSVQALGRSQEEALAATDAIGQAVSLSGASSEAAAAALLQLGQALASGQLRGEEFNSVIEQTPRLAQAIADGLGAPIGSLRTLAQEGRITSAALLDALLNERARLAEEYASLPVTVAGALTRLRNAFQQSLGEREAGLGLMAGLARAIELVATHLDLLIDLAGVALVAAVGRMASAFATAVSTTSILGRAVGLLRGAFALLGGPIGVVVTAVGLIAASLYSARDSLIEFGGRTASIRQIVVAAWNVVAESVGTVVSAITRMVDINDLSWARVRETMVGALNAIGAAVRATANTIIGTFNAIGSVVGTVSAFIVERFRNAFSDIRALARALGQDVAAALTGDLSMRALRDALSRKLSEVRDFGSYLADTVRDAVTRDYVGEIAQSIAQRIRPEPITPGVFGRPQPPAEPTPNGEAARLATAQAEAEFRIFKDALNRQSRALDRALEDRLISLRDYYAAKTRIEQQEIDAEIRRVQVMLAEQRRLQRAGEVAKLEADLIILNNRRADIEAANARMAAQAERELADALAQVRDELAQITGTSTAEDRRAAIERSYRDLRARLTAEGDTEGVSLIDRLIDVKTAQANLDALETAWRHAHERMRISQDEARIAFEAGLITQSEYQARVAQASQEAAHALDALIPKMQQAAASIGPEASLRVADFTNRLVELQTVVDPVAQTINTDVKNAFVTMFEQIGTGAKTAKGAILDFARSVIASLQRIVAQRFAEQIFAGFGKGGGGIGGIFSSLLKGASSVFKGFASGGYVTGPGTSTSDSILARLSAGEYVIRADAVRRFGVAFLDAINGMRLPPSIVGGRLAFATGGLVPSVGGVVNNVDIVVHAEGSSVSGDTQSAAELGRRIESAVRAVLISERRPGGLLSGA